MAIAYTEKMAAPADDDRNRGVGISNVEASLRTAAAAGSSNQMGASTHTTAQGIVYNCRMCRRTVFSAADIESHEAAKHNFHRRKSKGVTSTGPCSSIFLSEPKRWMKQQAGEMEGKLSCPNKACGARLGSLKWTGAQCSCGSWVTPAIQFLRKNLDARPRVSAGPPPGTVVHPSLLIPDGGGDAASVAATIATATDAATSAGAAPGPGGSGDVVGVEGEGGGEEEEVEEERCARESRCR